MRSLKVQQVVMVGLVLLLLYSSAAAQSQTPADPWGTETPDATPSQDATQPRVATNGEMEDEERPRCFLNGDGQVTCIPDQYEMDGSVLQPPRIRSPKSTNDQPSLTPDGTDGGRLIPLIPRKRKPEPPTEFQLMVYASTGQKLAVFGSRLFSSAPSTFAPISAVPVSADYMVGPGDELLIRGWGQVDVDFRATVSRTGEIYMPKVGAVAVSGIRYDQLQDHLKAAAGRIYRNFDLSVSMGRLRSIQVFVVGHAYQPGTFTVGALSTLVNTVFAAGGPSAKGSLRRIQLKRNGAVVTEFDMYDLLLRGDKSKDAFLRPGDVIYIPAVGPQVALVGSVKQPAVFELKEETELQELLEFAGGLTTTAGGQRLTLERIDQRRARVVEEIAMDNGGLSRALMDGDVVRVLPISARYENAVTLRGNVAFPGRYPWRDGMRIRDLIPGPDSLITRDYWRSQNAVVDPGIAFPSDSFGNPEQRKEGVTETALRNEVRRTAPEVNWDYALVQRLDTSDLATKLITFNLRNALLGHESDNLELRPGDVVTIFSESDMAVPIKSQSKFVRLEGEVRAAGVYRVEPGETLRQLVARAGGLTEQAYLFGAEFTRESIRAEQQERLDHFIRGLEAEVERNASAPTTAEDAAIAGRRAEAQRALIEKLKVTPASGKLVLEIAPTADSASVLPDIVLEDGDRFYVPFRPSSVHVVGAVQNENSFLYRTDKRVKDYLRQAGGGTKNADLGDMFVVRADGSVISRHWGSGFFKRDLNSLKLMPGDSIVVPEDLQKVGILKGLRDWSLVVSQFALGAAAIKVLGD